MSATIEPLRVGIVGAGRIGSLLCRALSARAPTIALTLASRDRSRCEALRHDIPNLAIAEPAVLARHVDILVLAVPAEACLALLRSLSPSLAPDCVVVGLTNGVALDVLGQATANPIVKVVPTIAHLVGRGVALMVPGPHTEDRHLARVAGMLSAIARPVVIDDRDARVASNVAGSFVALAAAFTDAFVRENADRALTLDRAQIEAMAAEALGAVSDLAAAGHPLADIAAATATPGGPTEAALAVLASGAERMAAGMVEATFRHQASQREAACRARDR